MQVGTDYEGSQELVSSTGGIRDLSKIKSYTHRIIAGGIKLHEVWYPTIRQNESGDSKQSWNVLKVPNPKEFDNVFSPIVRVDEEFKKKVNRDTDVQMSVRSRLTPNLSYLYLVFDREDEELKISVYKYKYSVAKRIAELEKMIDPVDKTKLMNGPCFAWDAIIKHSIDDKAGAASYQKHQYSAEVYSPSNKFAGKFPKDLFDKGKFPNAWDAVNKYKEVMFSKEELNLINACEIDLKELAKPMNEEMIQQELAKCPFNPYAISGTTSSPIFLSAHVLAEEMVRLSLPTVSKDETALLEETTQQGSVSVELTPSKEVAPQQVSIDIEKNANDVEKPNFVVNQVDIDI